LIATEYSWPGLQQLLLLLLLLRLLGNAARIGAASSSDHLQQRVRC